VIGSRINAYKIGGSLNSSRWLAVNLYINSQPGGKLMMGMERH